MLEAFQKRFKTAVWALKKEDLSCETPEIREAIVAWQDPKKVDTITKIRSTLDDTKGVLTKTIDDML